MELGEQESMGVPGPGEALNWLVLEIKYGAHLQRFWPQSHSFLVQDIPVPTHRHFLGPSTTYLLEK